MQDRSSPTSYPRARIRVLLVEGIHPAAEALFREHGYTHITTAPGALTGKELLEATRQVHLLGSRSKTLLNESFFAKAQKLIACGCFCIGTNQVDLPAATRAGIGVFNSPYSNTRSVAELVIAHAISLLRKVPEKSLAAHEGRWLKASRHSHEVRGKTLGIVGYGHIGSQVSVLAESLGMRVVYHDIVPRLSLGNAVPVATLDTLCRQADAVTLHVPGSPLTRNLFDSRRLRRMKKGAVLINLSRGDVLDAGALRDSLADGHLGGAAVDVFAKEPSGNDEPFRSPLQGLPNVILTPHIGGSTEEAQRQIGIDVATQMIRYLETGNSTGSLTVPALSLPVQHKAHRLLHIHENVPGVLGEINGLLSALKVNILGQYLKTNERIGYVVLDIDARTPAGVMKALGGVPHTIRVRSLY